ncbi:imelysin family protein [Vibrio algivorus]|uniref:Peptidase n=1 Tax=Vibrio algivorus TaxID=1667024 RepID=A0ABQ6ENP9_9VIBR|nr:imelysin family protein [Vibrio algivorus]GLT14449.1 peptidase [Vibrio algivorus]
MLNLRTSSLIISSLLVTGNTAFAASTPKDVVSNYANIAYAVFDDAYITAQQLQTAVDTLIENPSAETLEQARKAWLASRVPYQQSETFRFGNAIVDDWEGQLNAWPLDEGLIDYVADGYHHELGNEGAQANIIANKTIQVGADKIDASKITPELLASLNELAGSEANVATGYHAIEFLLWGQDLHGTEPGAGERSYTDYIQGEGCTNGNCERRAQYLSAASQLLVQDLGWMKDQWSTEGKDNYRSALLQQPAEEGLRKMLFGMGSLSLGELAGERMKVALEANSTEDEHDCFSDNTHNSHFYNEQGIYNVFNGSYTRVDGSEVKGASIKDLAAEKDKAATDAIAQQFDETRSSVHKLVESAENNNQHFDQLIAANNKSGNELVNNAINSLVKQTEAIEKVASLVGVTSLSPDNADHEF